MKSALKSQSRAKVLNPRLAGKTVKLKEDRSRSVERRHPWIFSGAVAAVPDRPAGSIVDLTAHDGSFLGRGFLNRNSQIVLRVLTWDQSQAIDAEFIRAKIQSAFAMRRSLIEGADSNAWRMFSSEADGIPGLIVDRFADTIVVQSTTAGVDLLMPTIVDTIKLLLKPDLIVERSNDTNREREGLELRDHVWSGKVPESGVVEIVENGCIFHVSLASGHKTGFYLDQKLNRALVAKLANDRTVLDTFSYSGGFTLNALRHGARSVTSVDSSQPALDLLAANLAANRLSSAPCKLVCSDVFEYLRTLREDGKNFDLVILDPPKLARSGANITKAARAYQDLNRLAFEILRPGGFLATFSCSGHMGLDLFQKVVFGAANHAQVDAHLVQIMLQSPDHPVHLNIPESLYLKGLICRKI